MELGPQNHCKDGLLGPNSTMAVYMDPSGLSFPECSWAFRATVQVLSGPMLLCDRVAMSS